jgi:hypothetical protein
MRVLNSLIARLLAILLGPFSALPPLAGLTLVSLLVAIGLLAAFKWTSNQRAIAHTKRQILASLFELRLFQDDPRLMLRAIAGLLAQQARYLAHAFVPLLVVTPPLALLLPHLHAYYGYQSIRPGESTVVIARLKPNVLPPQQPLNSPEMELQAPAGVHVDTPCVFATTPWSECAWRITAVAPGDFELAIQFPTGWGRSTKRLRVTDAIVARAPTRPTASFWDEWRAPAEEPLPATSPFEAITTIYPSRAIDVLGHSWPWPVVFFALTTLFVLIGRPLFHIVI